MAERSRSVGSSRWPVVVLILLGCAFAVLFSDRTSTTDLFGTSSGNTNVPVVESELDFPDVAPDRAAIVVEHARVLKELSEAYGEMAQGYSDMRSPQWFKRGQDQVAGLGST